MTRKMNFNAGPAALPLPALERAREELLDFEGSGMWVMEHSHRGKEYEEVHDEAIALAPSCSPCPRPTRSSSCRAARRCSSPRSRMNFLAPGKAADYVVTGAWGEKAVGEAKVVAAMLGASVAAQTTGTGDGKEKSYVRVPAPAELKLDPAAAYLHFTTNETIHGVEYTSSASRAFPGTGGGAARRRHVERLPLAPVRRVEVRPRLRRRAEEHRPERRRGRDRLEGARRARAQGPPQDLPVPHPRREQVALQHAADLRHLPGPQRARLAEGAGRPRRDGGSATGRRRRSSTAPSTAPGLLPLPRWRRRAARS